MGDLLFIRFFASGAMIGLVLLGILGVKKLCATQLTIKAHHGMGVVVLVLLIVPFVPKSVLEPLDLWARHTFSEDNLEQTMHSQVDTELEANKNMQGENIQDLAVNLEYSSLKVLDHILGVVWVIGAMLWACIYLRGHKYLWCVKRTSRAIQDKEIIRQYQCNKEALTIKKDIGIYESSRITTPMAFGVFKTYIILPTRQVEDFSHEEVAMILLHELHHYKQKDLLINYVIALFSMIYWFNPVVHKAFKQMKIDREVACDHAVLSGLDKKKHIVYGRTIIHFVENMSSSRNLVFGASIGGTKCQIKKRIEAIASYKKDTWRTRLKSASIIVIMISLVLSQIPTVVALAYERYVPQFGESEVYYEDLSTHFQGVEGTFVLYDMEKDRYTIYNKQKSVERVAPNSTYKIYSALIGLQEGVISAKDSTLIWDGNNYEYNEWNHDQDLESALRNSTTWYFQSLDTLVGRKTIQAYLDKLDYGNTSLIGSVEHYWLEGSLKISPIEQVQMLHSFYNNTLAFDTEHLEVVKSMIRQFVKNDVSISGKTGTGMVNGEVVKGSYIGYVEDRDNTYIFATYIENEEGATGKDAVEITLDILEDKKIY